MAADIIIEAKNLSKSFGKFRAVEDLSFAINHGDVYGFLGQNGAGKSTTMRMLLGLIFPDEGSVYIKGEKFGNSSRHLLKHVGAVIERPDLYKYLSGWDNLRMFAQLSGVPIATNRLHEVLEIVGLKGREQDKVKGYSQGMKQRLGIAIAMVHNPDLLILDEPTNGLDPQGIYEMRVLIQRLSKDFGKTILISSHLLYEIEQIATRMIIINRGKKIIEGDVATLLSPDDTNVDVRIGAVDITTSLKVSQWASALTNAVDGKLQFRMNPSNIPALNKWLVAQGADVYEINASHSLEAYFLSLTNEDNAKA
ncbi:MAG TPA: ABC transporter ATP-binding protein [Flavipsychrobacter sp.]|nr:ABC transporter ATP-binding protein [Flavipsychrobacter sp.]